MDFPFFSYDYLEIFDGDSNTAPVITKWGGYGRGQKNKIFKCDGNIKCCNDQKCKDHPPCEAPSTCKPKSTVQLSSRESRPVTPEKWVENRHRNIM